MKMTSFIWREGSGGAGGWVYSSIELLVRNPGRAYGAYCPGKECWVAWCLRDLYTHSRCCFEWL